MTTLLEVFVAITALAIVGVAIMFGVRVVKDAFFIKKESSATA